MLSWGSNNAYWVTYFGASARGRSPRHRPRDENKAGISPGDCSGGRAQGFVTTSAFLHFVVKLTEALFRYHMTATLSAPAVLRHLGGKSSTLSISFVLYQQSETSARCQRICRIFHPALPRRTLSAAPPSPGTFTVSSSFSDTLVQLLRRAVGIGVRSLQTRRPYSVNHSSSGLPVCNIRSGNGRTVSLTLNE